MAQPASNALSLTSTKRKTAWNDLNCQASEQTLPNGFNATVGATVPSAVSLQPIPEKTGEFLPLARAFAPGRLLSR